MVIYRNNYRYVYIHELVYTFISVFCHPREPRSKDTSVETSPPSTQIWLLLPFCNKMNRVSFEKWLIIGLKQEIYKMNLKHLVVVESMEVLNKNNKKT